MVNIQLLCVGKLKEKHFAAACAEYVKRLGAFCKLTVTELPEDRLPDNPSQAQIDAALEKEAAAILAKIPKGSKIVALCVEGKLLSSPDLAQELAKWTVGRGLSLYVSHRRVLWPAPLGEGEGAVTALHVPHDLPPPLGAGDGPGANLPGLSDQRRDPLPQINPSPQTGDAQRERSSCDVLPSTI